MKLGNLTHWGDYNMKLEHINYVLEISKTGSINKASENLYLSQPYLSKCLKELESELGVQLIERSSRGTILTEHGEKFIEYASIINHYIGMIEAMGKNEKSSIQIIKVACFFSYTLMNLFQNSTFKRYLEKFDFQYFETRNTEVFEYVNNGKANLGIMYLDSVNYNDYIKMFEKNDLIFNTIIEEGVYAIVSKNHPLYKFNEVSIENLKPYTLVMEKYKLQTFSDTAKSNYLDSFLNSFNIDTLNLDNNSSLLYHISTSDSSFTIGQKLFNIDNPLVKYGDIKYLLIKDLDFSLITGILYNKKLVKLHDLNDIFDLIKKSINTKL